MIKIKINDNIYIQEQDKDIAYYKYNTDDIKCVNTNDYDFKILRRDEVYYCCVSEKYEMYIFNNINYGEKKIDLCLSGLNKLVLDEAEIYIYNDQEEYAESDATELPFVVPHYCTYPVFTAIQGILKGHNNELEWIYNNYIQVWADKSMVSRYYWADFKFANEEIREEFCPLIYKKNGGKIEGDCVEKIKVILRQKYYVIVSIDMFDIDEWWQGDCEKWHAGHQTLIYGYNDSERVFLTADFYSREYKKVKIAYDKFVNAYTSELSDNDYESIYLKYIPAEYKIDLDLIAGHIQDFLQSKDSVYFNYINISKVNMVSYGLEFIERIKSLILDMNRENEEIDIRPLHIIYEINNIMKKRMQYLVENGYVNYSEKVNGSIDICCKYSAAIRNVILKHNCLIFIRPCKLNDEDIVERMDKLKILVKEMLELCYENITGQCCYDSDKEQIEDYEINKELLSDSKQLLCEANVDKLIDGLNKEVNEQKIYSFKNRDVFMFPFVTEIFWNGDLGEPIQEHEDEMTEITYLFDHNRKMLAHVNLSSQFSDATQKTYMIYKYGEKQIDRYVILEDEETGNRMLSAVDIFLVEDDIIQEYVRTTEDNHNTIGKIEYKNGKPYIYAFGEMSGDKVLMKCKDIFYFDDNNTLKQILQRNEATKDVSLVFPKYGVKELDYYYFSNKLYECLCNSYKKKSMHLVKMIIDIIIKDSRVKIEMQYEDRKVQSMEIDFMKNYEKETFYEKKLTTVVLESLNKFIAEKLVDKSYDDWNVEVRCNDVMIKKYNGRYETEMANF